MSDPEERGIPDELRPEFERLENEVGTVIESAVARCVARGQDPEDIAPMVRRVLLGRLCWQLAVSRCRAERSLSGNPPESEIVQMIQEDILLWAEELFQRLDIIIDDWLERR
jgi:hypothetical protein